MQSCHRRLQAADGDAVTVYCTLAGCTLRRYAQPALERLSLGTASFNVETRTTPIGSAAALPLARNRPRGDDEA